MAEPLQLTPDEVEHLKGYKLIPAIKSVRERTGIGLPQARDFVYEEALRLGIMEDAVCHTCNGSGQMRQWKR